MSLDATARQSNLKDSLKKYLIDTVRNSSGIPVTFDKSLATPKLSNSREVTRWVNVRMGPMEFEDLSYAMIDIYCCTRRDNEGFRLAQLRDIVMGYLSDTAADGIKRIPFYRSHETDPWELIGGIVVQRVTEGPELEGADESKYKILTVELRFASKI